jgi:tetratricopeptide (TPR) repeat protein
MSQQEKKPLCFVIMGFGEKKDPETNRTINLNDTYKKIIRPAVEACNYRCVRADEISDSGLIDRSMYALLYHAELVIADISTFNANAIYELGTRHALRPYSTIIIKDDTSIIPFDFNHNRILLYHFGNDISEKEAKKSISELKEIINSIPPKPTTDSPLYSFIPKIQQPVLSENDLNEIIGDIRSKEDSIYSLTEKAKEYMSDAIDDVMQQKFRDAADIWKRLSAKTNNDIYYIQQQALCVYKSEYPTKMKALTDALQIISVISTQLDTETLGISAAINKRLWDCLKESDKATAIGYLDEAIRLYKQGWSLYQDYYTGQNYADCLEQKSLVENDCRYKIYLQVEAVETRKKIIDIILPTLEEDNGDDLMWKYATLANCYLAIGDKDQCSEYENKFMKENPENWQIETYNRSKDGIINFKDRR